jgi:hypothetical protein
MAKFPIKLPRGPQDELCTLFKELQLDVMAPPKQAQPPTSWISAPTWALINKRAILWQQGKLPQQALNLIGQQIMAGLKGDRRQQAAEMAEAIDKHLAGGETKEAWQCLKGWYKTASKSAPAASPMLLATQTAKCVALYGRVPSPGEPLPIQVDKADVLDGPPSNWELRSVVRGLRNRHAAGASGLQAEHIKVWLCDDICKEEEDSDVGLGDKWRIFVRLMQAIWEHGSVPKQMRWEIIVLLPKGNSEYCGISLLNPFWKVVEKIMVAWLALIQFYDSLHGRLSKRGTGTAMIEAKLH